MTSPKIHLFSFSLRAYKRRGQKNDVILCKLPSKSFSMVDQPQVPANAVAEAQAALPNESPPASAQGDVLPQLELPAQAQPHEISLEVCEMLFSVLLWPRVPFKFPLFGLLEFYGLFQLDIFLFVLLLAFVFYVRFAGLLPISNFIFCSPCFERLLFYLSFAGY